MKNYRPFSLYRLLLIALVMNSSALVTTITQAQCCRHCRRPNLPVLTVPMWEVYGINPWNPQQVPVSHFTPLQANNYGYTHCIDCQNHSDIGDGEVYLGEVSASEIPPGADVAVAEIDLVAGASQDDPAAAVDLPPVDESAQQLDALKKELENSNAKLESSLNQLKKTEERAADAMNSSAQEIDKLAEQSAQMTASNEELAQRTKILEDQLQATADRLAAANKDRVTLKTQLKKNQTKPSKSEPSKSANAGEAKSNQTGKAWNMVRQLREEAKNSGMNRLPKRGRKSRKRLNQLNKSNS